MRLPYLKRIQLLFSAFLLFSVAQAQQSPNIEWSNDTISKADALGSRNVYLKSLRDKGDKATERINLPVNKLKDIFDACYSNGITEVSVMIVTLRQSDIPKYRKNNPGSSATDAEIKGSQLIVFKIPRRAFTVFGAKINPSSNNPLMMSLLGAGLMVLEKSYSGLSTTGDVYFSIGGICPPPAACDEP